MFCFKNNTLVYAEKKSHPSMDFCLEKEKISEFSGFGRENQPEKKHN